MSPILYFFADLLLELGLTLSKVNHIPDLKLDWLVVVDDNLRSKWLAMEAKRDLWKVNRKLKKTYISNLLIKCLKSKCLLTSFSLVKRLNHDSINLFNWIKLGPPSMIFHMTSSCQTRGIPLLCNIMTILGRIPSPDNNLQFQHAFNPRES